MHAVTCCTTPARPCMPPPLRAPLLRSSAELALRPDERGERLAEGGGDVGEARHQPIYNFYFDLFKVCIQILENRRVQLLAINPARGSRSWRWWRAGRARTCGHGRRAHVCVRQARGLCARVSCVVQRVCAACACVVHGWLCTSQSVARV